MSAAVSISSYGMNAAFKEGAELQCIAESATNPYERVA